MKPTATAAPASAPSASTPAAGAVMRRSAVSFAETSRQSSPIGANRKGRVAIATIPSVAAAAARTLLTNSLFTVGDSSGLSP